MSAANASRRGDLAFAGLVLLVGAAAGALAFAYPADARLWPLLAVAATLIGAAGAIARLARGAGAQEGDEDHPIASPRRAALFVGLVVLFDLILVNLGFLTAGAFALVAVPLLLGERRLGSIAATAVVVLAAAWLLFEKLAKQGLPADWFWN